VILCLEGPSYAGKTTVIRRLRELLPEVGALFLECYVERIPSEKDVPPPRTRSAAEQLRAFRIFMAIEAERVAQVADGSGGLVVLDRSVDTLLAHAYALEQMYGFQVYGQVREILAELPYLRPDQTVYLDASPGALRLRRAAEIPDSAEDDYFLHDSRFLAYTREYFVGPRQGPVARQVAVAPSDGPVDTVANNVRVLVESWSR